MHIYKKINNKNEFHEEALEQFKTYLEHMRNEAGINLDNCEEFNDLLKKDGLGLISDDEYLKCVNEIEDNYINDVYEKLIDMKEITIKSGSGDDFVSWEKNDDNKIIVAFNNDEYLNKYDFYEFILLID